MNILIITPFYKHDRNIASVRWTNIGVRLAKKHNVIVVTQPHDDMDMNTTIERDEDNILVARLNQKTSYEKLAVKHFGGATGDDWQTASGSGQPSEVRDDFKRKLKNKLLYSSMKSKAKQYTDDIVKKVIPKDTKIDVVISSACPFIEMLFGYELKKKLGCKWISDFRDLPFIEDNCDDTHIQKKIMENVLLESDVITVVINRMETHLRYLLPCLKKQRIEVISNGFSMNDYIEPEQVKQDRKLHLGYTGSLSWDNSTDMLFSAIEFAKKKYVSFDAVIECAGGNNQSIINTAKEHGLEHIVTDYGFLPREDALKLQRESDMLLVTVRNFPGRGFAAKLYEYLLNQKPIICLILYKYEKCDAEKFIESLNLGFVANENTREKSINDLADYLIMQYKRKEAGIPLLYEPNEEKVKQYDHDNIVIGLEKILEEIVVSE